MSILRDIAYAAGALASAPLWGWRMLRTGKWRTDWKGRLGHAGIRPDPRPTLLIHAVSVGEVNAVRQLVTKLEERHADRLRIVISVTTDTGTAQARRLFEPRHAVVRYPLDFTRCVRRFLNSVRPDAVALVELEVWPNFVEECTRRRVPVAVINGRLSGRSHGRYRKIRPLIRQSFSQLHTVAAQDGSYAQRFIDLGARADRVVVTGTMKWDTAVIRDEVPGSHELALAMGIDRTRPLVVCGSTGPGEEQTICDLRLECEGVQLLVAPRKPERFEEVAVVMGHPVRRTHGRPSADGQATRSMRFLLDTLGELSQAYALADVVVVGRTFTPLGGSDMIEPVALGKPTVIGPHVANFQSTVELLRAEEAIIQVQTHGELSTVLRELLSDAQKRRGLAERGREVIRRNQGATDRHVRMIESLLPNLKVTPGA